MFNFLCPVYAQCKVNSASSGTVGLAGALPGGGQEASASTSYGDRHEKP